MARQRIIAVIAAALTAALVSGPSAMAQLTGQDRSTFVQGSIEHCFSTPQYHTGVPPTALNAFCACMAYREADIATPQDFAYMTTYHVAPPGFDQRVQPLAATCNATAGSR